MNLIREKLELVQAYEGVGTFSNLAARKDLNVPAILFKYGGMHLDADNQLVGKIPDGFMDEDLLLFYHQDNKGLERASVPPVENTKPENGLYLRRRDNDEYFLCNHQDQEFPVNVLYEEKNGSVTANGARIGYAVDVKLPQGNSKKRIHGRSAWVLPDVLYRYPLNDVVVAREKSPVLIEVMKEMLASYEQNAEVHEQASALPGGHLLLESRGLAMCFWPDVNHRSVV
jgi:hypothetical protein